MIQHFLHFQSETLTFLTHQTHSYLPTSFRSRRTNHSQYSFSPIKEEDYGTTESPHSTLSITTIPLNLVIAISNKHTLLNSTLTRTSPSDSQYNQCTSASPPPSTYLLSQTQPHTIPFSSFQLFHFAFSYTLTIPFLSYGIVEHARSTDITISNRCLLEQRVTSQLVLVAHRLRWMPTTNELRNLVELLLSHHILLTLATSRSDISHSQQTILYFFFNFFFSFISFIRNFNASKCAFNSSKFVVFRFK